VILLAAMLIAVQAVPPRDGEDIVVVARRIERLKRMRMTTRIDPATGITHCVFKRRSGDPALDAIVCDAVRTCAARVATMAEVRTCMAPTIDPLLAKGARWEASATDRGQ